MDIKDTDITALFDDDDNECFICGDEPCTCFEGTRRCQRCGKEYTKYSRVHTCANQLKN